MPHLDLNADTVSVFRDRVNGIRSTDQRQWGTMSVAQMFAHLRILFEISLEERATVDESRAWLMPILWLLFFRVWTRWPRGIVKASPQFLADTVDEDDAERERLLAAMDRFVVKAAANPEHLVLEPMLGRVSLAKWRRIHGVHTDYHLRQFGV